MSILYQGINQRIFGTWPLKGDDARNAVEQAIQVGYRSIDTAQMYENEAEVGAAIAASGIPRDQFCITTKVHPDNFTEDSFLPSVEASIKALGTNPDLLLLHWPAIGGDVVPSLKMLQTAFDQGMSPNIGISNYTISQMETAVSVLEAPISTNQVEMHPLINQSVLLNAASRLGIPMTSYCSVAKGRIFEQPELIEIGQQIGKSVGQVALRWLLQKGVTPVVMSTKLENVTSNFDVMNFTLSNADMARIDALAAKVHDRIVVSVPWAPEWDA